MDSPPSLSSSTVCVSRAQCVLEVIDEATPALEAVLIPGSEVALEVIAEVMPALARALDITGEDVPETATVLEIIVESVARAWDSPRNHS
jgi:hypothetical protein